MVLLINREAWEERRRAPLSQVAYSDLTSAAAILLRDFQAMRKQIGTRYAILAIHHVACWPCRALSQ